ncbi:Fc.00g055900.m01.CDS01 [Cosmosporella sp. VM-42]
MADLERVRPAAEAWIVTLPDPSQVIFVPANTIVWSEMKELFQTTIKHFTSVDVVIANAGVMESHAVLDVETVDANGDLLEATEASKVIDINLKGTLNTLRLGLHHMKDNKARFPDGSRGSIVLISSTSGYFGGTGVTAYISSKHGVTGLLRSSQLMAARYNVRVNGVAPFVTPTTMAGGFAAEWAAAGHPINTTEQVALVIATISQDPKRKGACYLACGSIIREMEGMRGALLGKWLGDDVAQLMASASTFFADLGGYPLPKLDAIQP